VTSSSLPPYLYLSFLLRDELVVAAGAGDCHTTVVTSTGKVYTWGCYKDSEDKPWRLGNSGEDSYQKIHVRPVIVPFINGAVDVSCGASHSLLLLRSRMVMSFGMGDKGQLGRRITLEYYDGRVGGAEGVLNKERV